MGTLCMVYEGHILWEIVMSFYFEHTDRHMFFIIRKSFGSILQALKGAFDQQLAD